MHWTVLSVKSHQITDDVNYLQAVDDDPGVMRKVVNKYINKLEKMTYRIHSFLENIKSH